MKARAVWVPYPRPRCACSFVPCSHPAPVGDTLCQACRRTCVPEMEARALRRRKRIALAILAAVGGISWAIGHLIGPMVGG